MSSPARSGLNTNSGSSSGGASRMRMQRARAPKLSVGASTLNNNYGGYLMIHHPTNSYSQQQQQQQQAVVAAAAASAQFHGQYGQLQSYQPLHNHHQLTDYSSRNAQINPNSFARAGGSYFAAATAAPNVDPYSRPVTADDLRAKLMIAQQEQRQAQQQQQQLVAANGDYARLHAIADSSDSAGSLSGDGSPPPPAPPPPPPPPRCAEEDEEEAEVAPDPDVFARLRQRHLPMAGRGPRAYDDRRRTIRSVYFASPSTLEAPTSTLIDPAAGTEVPRRRQMPQTPTGGGTSRGSLVERSASTLSDYEAEEGAGDSSARGHGLNYTPVKPYPADYFIPGGTDVGAVIGTPFRLMSSAQGARQRSYPDGRERRYEEAKREAAAQQLGAAAVDRFVDKASVRRQGAAAVVSQQQQQTHRSGARLVGGQLAPKPPAPRAAVRRSPAKPGAYWRTDGHAPRAVTLRAGLNGTASTSVAESSDGDELSSDLGEREPGDGEEEERYARSRLVCGPGRLARRPAGAVEDEEDDGIDEDVDDEDVVDCLDDDDDGDSGSMTSSTGGSRATSRLTLNGDEPASADGPVRKPLMESNFSYRPPVIRFVPPGERVEPLPWEYRKLLKWRMSSITPLVVKYCVQRSGFRISKKREPPSQIESYDWIGYFGKHMKSTGFRSIREYQKINHFPGTFQIGRKDRLWRNLYKMQVQHGKKEFNFFPQTFCLPADMKQLKRVWEDGGNKQKWIVKPPASARGIGVRVVHKWSQIPKKRPVIVQRYLYKPLLINGSKFDLRIYVYVSSFDPLRIYIHEDGLVRFASQKYSSATKNLSNRFMHLTNYSVNKKNIEYKSNSDDTVCQGHKWSLKSLWPYLREHFHADTDAIWGAIKDIVVKTILSAESLINSMIKTYVRRRHSVHELFGFDILLDETLKPWILECNISPSLHSNSQLDVNIKGQMISDMMCLAGFEIPEKMDLAQAQMPFPSDLNRYEPSTALVTDKRLWDPMLSPDERAKHAFFCQRAHDEMVQQMMLDCLTPDDLRILTESVDEWGRAGGFQRVFPCQQPGDTMRYLRFMSQPRYYNLLLHAFLCRFHGSRSLHESKAVDFLESMCQQKLHLQAPTTDPQHQWTAPSALLSARGDVPASYASGHPGSASAISAGANGPRRGQPGLRKNSSRSSLAARFIPNLGNGARAASGGSEAKAS